MTENLKCLLISAWLLCGGNAVFGFEYVTADGDPRPLRWTKREIPYYINPMDSGLSIEQIRPAIESAFRSWRNTGLNISFRYMGETPLKDGNDGTNVFFWDATGAVTGTGLGTSSIYRNVGAAEIVDVDVAFNAATTGEEVITGEPCNQTGRNFGGIPIVWSIGEQGIRGIRPFSSFHADVQATATHEIGHFLGLGHSEVVGATMATVENTPGFYCTTDQASLEPDDEAGIHFLYPDSSRSIIPTWLVRYDEESAMGVTDVQEASNDGYFASGWRGRDRPSKWILRLDPRGRAIWQRSYGAVGLLDGLRKIASTTDGGCVGIEMADGDTLEPPISGVWPTVMKLDASGNVEWRKLYQTGRALWGGRGVDLKETSDGGYVIVGDAFAELPLPTAVAVLRLDAAGVVMWAKTYYEAAESVAYSVTQTSDRNFVVVASVDEMTGSPSVSVLKIGEEGDLLWHQRYEEPGVLKDVSATVDGGFVAAGVTCNLESAGDCREAWIVKFKKDGAIEWQRSFNATQQKNSFCLAESVKQRDDSTYIVGGNIEETDIFILRLDPSGQVLNGRSYDCGFAGPLYESAPRAVPTRDGGVITASRNIPWGVGEDSTITLLKLDRNLAISSSCAANLSLAPLLRARDTRATVVASSIPSVSDLFPSEIDISTDVTETTTTENVICASVSIERIGLVPSPTKPGTLAVTFAFQTIPGEEYAVEYKELANAAGWTPLQTFLGDGALRTVVDEIQASGGRLYRVRR